MGTRAFPALGRIVSKVTSVHRKPPLCSLWWPLLPLPILQLPNRPWHCDPSAEQLQELRLIALPLAAYFD